MFTKDISYAFLYEKKDTFLYGLDPRIKIFYSIISVFAIFYAGNLKVALVMLLLHLMIASIGGLSRKILSLIRGLIPFLVFIMAFNTFLSYLVASSFNIESLAYTFSMSVLRVLTTLIIVTVLIATTSPQEIMQAFVKMGVSYVYAYPIIITFRFIPIIFSEIGNIYDSQRARGLELEKGNLLEKAKKLVPIIVPAIVCALLRAKELAEAMEARSFGAYSQRTFYKPISVKIHDIVFFTLTTVASLSSIIFM